MNKVIKKVLIAKGGSGGICGRIYLPKDWVNKFVNINLLNKKEETEYLKKKLEHEKKLIKKEINYQNHLLKLKKLRGLR